MRFVGELPTPAVYTVGTPAKTVTMSCSFIFKDSMIFVAYAFDKGSCSAVARPFVLSRNIFCPATIPGLKLPVNGFSFQITTVVATTGNHAPDTASDSAVLMLGWFGSGKNGGTDEFLRRFLDINVQSKVVLNLVSDQTIVV